MYIYTWVSLQQHDYSSSMQCIHFSAVTVVLIVTLQLKFEDSFKAERIQKSNTVTRVSFLSNNMNNTSGDVIYYKSRYNFREHCGISQEESLPLKLHSFCIDDCL